MKYTLSIIIPVYNVEKYILDCVQSIFSQLPKNVEIIFVDDGSPDSSIFIIRNELAKLNNRFIDNIVILQQRNMGQSVARNHGISVARGEYIGFIDSDDKIDKSYFQEILSIINNFQPDFIRFNAKKFSSVDSDLGEVLKYNEILGLNAKDEKVLTQIFKQGAWFSWLNIVKKSLIEGVEFPKGFYFEDVAIIPSIIMKANSIYFSDRHLYCYRINQNSSIHSTTAANIEKNIKSFNFILNYYRNRIYQNKFYSGIYLKIFQGYVGYLVKNKSINCAKKEYLKFNERNLKDDKTLNFKNKIFKFSGLFYIYILYIRNKVVHYL